MKRKIALHLLIVIAFGAAAYANSFSNEFLYDDEHYIQRNTYIRDFSHLRDIFTKNVGAGAFRLDNFYRPIQLLAYTIVYRIFGLNLFGYHLLNLLLHLGNAILIYFIISALFEKKEISLICSLLFTVHPVHTEAITYMNGTADPLAMLFGLGSLILYLRANQRITYYLFSLISFSIALLSKETMVILPFLIILLDLYQRKFSKKRCLDYIPYFVLTGGYIGLRATIFNFTKSLNLFTEPNLYTQNLHYRIFTFLASLVEYYKLLLAPINLQFDRKMVVFVSLFSPQVIVSLMLLLVFAYFGFRSFKNNRGIFLGFIWFFVSLGPVSGIIPINGFCMEHWLYLPSIGFLIVLSYFMVKLNKRIYLPLLLLIAIIFSYRIIERNKDWKDPITFYNKILEHNPSVARVHNNLAMAYADKGLPDKAETHYRMAISIEDRYAEPHHNLALLYFKKDMVKEGIAELKRAIAINENFIYSHLALREVYEKLGRHKEAEEELKKINEIINR